MFTGSDLSSNLHDRRCQSDKDRIMVSRQESLRSWRSVAQGAAQRNTEPRQAIEAVSFKSCAPIAFEIGYVDFDAECGFFRLFCTDENARL